MFPSTNNIVNIWLSLICALKVELASQGIVVKYATAIFFLRWIASSLYNHM